MIIGYMLVHSEEKQSNVHYIDLVDTVVRKNHLCAERINDIYIDYNVDIIPREIIVESAKYWAKMLDVIDDGTVKKILYITSCKIWVFNILM